LNICLHALRRESLPLQPAVRLRRTRAVERVKEAVAVAPAEVWSIARLGEIANLSAFHLCHVSKNWSAPRSTTTWYANVSRKR
jgi:hypothetical protein